MDSPKLRKDILAQRDLLSESRREEYSSRIMKRIVLMDQFQAAATVFTYVDFRSEVITAPLVKYMLESGKNVVVPVTLVRDKDLLAVSMTDPARELAPGYCSIPEPIMEIRESRTVSPDIIDIIFLPGSVFDERGGRMGYGGGYYDRFVSAKAPQALRVGLAYELQMVQHAPLQDHDEFLDFIVTEERTVVGNRNKIDA
ncbi:MAG TPA: 5-formyltetrahydrofolate cyclo-ligase [Desulfobacterales bacterium]|nr:5-formyltetrahydrofolate cyclo-ligase [Desulfobacterales bacterium]HIP40094.1 5-formyltetrahydrofolate cyclo-ligase [Desulfocapsa sulfexigens]